MTNIERLAERLTSLISHGIFNNITDVKLLRKRLRHPRELLQSWAQRLDNIELRLISSKQLWLQENHQRIQYLNHRITIAKPAEKIRSLNSSVLRLNSVLLKSIGTVCSLQRQKLENIVAQLELVSPLATLQRGYAIVRDKK